MNNTTVLDKKIDFELLTKSTELLDDDPEEPKTLEEIANKVGFPFKAKAVLMGSGKIKTLPIGETRTFIGRVTKVGEKHPYLPDHKNTDKTLIGFMWSDCDIEVFYPKIKRWVLVK